MNKIGIIDYGIGNLRSVANAVKHVGAKPIVSSDEKILKTCDRLILPGVGAFGYGMKAISETGLRDVIFETVEAERPLLGICLGMQMLLEHSSEFGSHQGLGIIPGNIDIFQGKPDEKSTLRLPNVGWLPITPTKNMSGLAATLFDDIPESARYYFVHSYKASAENSNCVATSKYKSQNFAAIVAKGSVIGAQFHPEKSGPAGLKLLEKFAN